VSEPLRFGVLTVQNQTWPEMVRRWRRVEDLGFDSVWIADHFVSPRPQWIRDPFFDGWTTLAALSATTNRVSVGTLVTSISLHNPAVLARQAMTVDHISNGRLEVGIGSAGSVADYEMTGTGPWAPVERMARLREVVEILDRTLRQSVTTYEGRFYSVRGAIMSPPPIQSPRPRLLIAAHGPAGLRLTAEYADTWNTMVAPSMDALQSMGMDKRVETVRTQNGRLDELCAEVGRDRTSVRRALLALEPMAGAFRSKNYFEEWVGRFSEVGIQEFLFFWPVPYGKSGDIDGQIQQEEMVMERVALEVIPKLRTQKDLN
jgi:alkanesulfonate monooxygenase SsuD/methylene tetrahydromethanopterin reductase-like flavin-dependent oxidoreductase (luciferase family)